MTRLPINPFGCEFHFSPGEKFDADLQTEIQTALEKEKLVVLRGLHLADRESFLEVALTFSKNAPTLEERLLHWSFGPVMELKVDPKPENYLFSEEPVPFHWDGAFHKEPSYLVFNCLEAPEANAGGETLFCDMKRVLEVLTSEERNLLAKARLTYKTEKKAHYGGEITISPLFQHPRTGEITLRYAEEVETALNPVDLVIEGVSSEDAVKLQQSLREKIYNPRFCYKHAWHSGDLLLSDNFATIHGRRAFLKNTPRHIRRIQVL
jgi:alpha-ketoglutarate-dependent taurine dioxygenase